MPSFPEMNIWLSLAGLLTIFAGILHLAIIIGGPDWLRFFGAGERMAEMAENGHYYPSLATGFIATALFVMGTYALSGAAIGSGSMVLPLPFIKTVLVLITLVFLLRGLALLPGLALVPEKITTFLIWSSVIVTVLGLIYLLGLWQVWERL